MNSFFLFRGSFIGIVAFFRCFFVFVSYTWVPLPIGHLCFQKIHLVCLGGQIGNCILGMRLLDRLKEETEDFLTICIDMEKAYDKSV